ncbi:MAG TPA: prepilin-type N-terminal cleavage/methylation domain-containing protein [Elusimicrobiales bacterium]|nr:prepilin-type N-terminal cleavage/methylation domain-containing protein [Elusimicrobiales bacterium]
MKNRKGFTLVELAVVIVIIGVLAAFGIPRFREAVERSKSGEAFNYLASVRAAQERYHARQASYAQVKSNLDINFPEPKYFSLWEITCDEDDWLMILQRTGKSAGYGAYTVQFTELGYSTDSNIPAVINAMASNN